MSEHASTATTYPPTQHLVMELLVARHRLGDPFWPFPQSCRRAVNALAEVGLVHIVKSHNIVGWIDVRLTDKGAEEWQLDVEWPREYGSSGDAG